MIHFVSLKQPTTVYISISLVDSVTSNTNTASINSNNSRPRIYISGFWLPFNELNALNWSTKTEKRLHLYLPNTARSPVCYWGLIAYFQCQIWIRLGLDFIVYFPCFSSTFNCKYSNYCFDKGTYLRVAIICWFIGRSKGCPFLWTAVFFELHFFLNGNSKYHLTSFSSTQMLEVWE